jgi:hypothetical protein
VRGAQCQNERAGGEGLSPALLQAAPDQSGNRPAFAPETREQSVSKRGESDERALSSLGFFAGRSLHTGEVMGSKAGAKTFDRDGHVVWLLRICERLDYTERDASC